MDETRHQINLKTLLLASVLNRVGHEGLVDYSGLPNSWITLVGHSRGSFFRVILVGKTRGSTSWVRLAVHSPRSRLLEI